MDLGEPPQPTRALEMLSVDRSLPSDAGRREIRVESEAPQAHPRGTAEPGDARVGPVPIPLAAGGGGAEGVGPEGGVLRDLARFAETRPLSRLANSRSAGIKDLRFGSLAQEDWYDVDPDELLRDRCAEVAVLPHASYHFIATTVTADRDHPFGRIVGDLFVRYPSGSGQGRRIPVELGHGGHVGSLHHFDLLNHPAVYRQICAWLAGDEAAVG